MNGRIQVITISVARAIAVAIEVEVFIDLTITIVIKTVAQFQRSRMDVCIGIITVITIGRIALR